MTNVFAIDSSILYIIMVALLIASLVLYTLFAFFKKAPFVANTKNTSKDSHIENTKKDSKNFNLRNIIDHHIFSSDINSINLNERCIINTINPHSYCTAISDLKFQKSLIESDILLPDGSGIVLAARVLRRKVIKKIAGADIHKHLLEHANSNHKKVFYLGASNATLDLISKRIKVEYSNIEISSYSPPYKPEFSNEDSLKMVEAVNAFNPDILFVGMTAPKQEKWVEENKQHLTPKIITSIGAVFDFYAGTVKRSSPFWIKIGLEWLPRLIKEPKRLWKRNFVSSPLFLFKLSKEKLLNLIYY